MPYLVKAFDTVAQSWVKWSTSSLSRAFHEYPGEAQGYPPVINLSEKVRVVRSVSTGISDGFSGIASSLWELVNDELVFGFHIEGHTGNWAVSIEQELVKEHAYIDLGFILEEDGELVPQLDDDKPLVHTEQGVLVRSGEELFPQLDPEASMTIEQLGFFYEEHAAGVTYVGDDIVWLDNVHCNELTPRIIDPDGGTPLYLEMLEVYPNLIGLSDTFWSTNGNDLVLGV